MSIGETSTFDDPAAGSAAVPPVSAANASTGILLSTLWRQSTMISLPGNTAIHYNEYTPLDPRNSKHSRTGCTNTAAAQIIHYFIARGLLDFSLTLNDGDAYTSSYEDVTISVAADGSTPGTLSFAAVNDYLAHYSVDSAECAAALLYACGVVQQAGYSFENTATPWSTELFYRSGFQSANNFSAKRNAKFATYFWGSTDGAGGFTISDAGFEVLIENLRAGRPVGASMVTPNHAVVIDGYDAENDLFHINYCLNSDEQTRWYSRAEMAEAVYYQFVYDLCPEFVETFSVTDGRVYGTGTMVRAFEQAASFRGDNTVVFAASVANCAVALPEYIVVRDSTTICNFNMTVTVNDLNHLSSNVGFYAGSAGATVFEDFGGAVIVNSKKTTNAVMDFTNGGSLSFSGRNTLLYAGSYAVNGDYSAGAATVLSALRSAREKETAVDGFVTASAVNGFGFCGTRGGDAVTLAERSIVVGKTDLRAGADTLTVTGNSRVYGNVLLNAGDDTVTVSDGSLISGNVDFGAGADTLSVSARSHLEGNISGNGTNTVTVDSSSTIAGGLQAKSELRFVLDSAAEDRAIFLVRNSVYDLCRYAAVSVDITDAEVGTYVLFAADDGVTDAARFGQLAVTVTAAGMADYTLVGNGSTTGTCADIVCESGALKLKVNIAPAELTPRVVSVSADITGLTDGSVTVTAVFNESAAVAQYSFDNRTWETYTGGVEMRVNGVVYFRCISAAGRLSEVVGYEVTNIIAAPDKPVAGDLNDDGRADVVITLAESTHPADGATGAWLIQSDQTAAWGDLSRRNEGWELFGTGSTAGGKNTADVYVRSEDNMIGAWVTDADGEVAGWQTVARFDANTQILGLGDFNGDGQSDLLLRNTNGAVGCYFTSGGLTGWNCFQSLGDEWTVTAVGDFNGDGRDDAVLKHAAGFTGSWLTQGDGTMAWADLDLLPEGGEIVGAGDFDGDGISDVLLRNGSYYGAWLVKNGSVSAWMGLGDLGDVTVEQIADFDADGRDDLRIRTAAGDLGVELVKGEDRLDWKYYGSVGEEWSTRLTAI